MPRKHGVPAELRQVKLCCGKIATAAHAGIVVLSALRHASGSLCQQTQPNLLRISQRKPAAVCGKCSGIIPKDRTAASGSQHAIRDRQPLGFRFRHAIRSQKALEKGTYPADANPTICLRRLLSCHAVVTAGSVA